MANAPSLRWLPPSPTFRAQLKAIPGLPMETAWESVVALANTRLDFIATNALDQVMRRVFADSAPPGLSTKPVRLALLGSSTLAHLHAAIRVAGVRRGIWITTYENDYGQYLQELLDPASALHAFRPRCRAVRLRRAPPGPGAARRHGREAGGRRRAAEVLRRSTQCWRWPAHASPVRCMQQTALTCCRPCWAATSSDCRARPPRPVARLNEALRSGRRRHGVDLVALDDRGRRDGLRCLARSRPVASRQAGGDAAARAPIYGELVGRLIGARQGLSRKCLVLDLDNTLWGGVIGDDGLDGIVLGQGSALGEGFAAVQDYARDLSRRGVILAVSSKNDEANALEPFDNHPEMVLQRADIASFQANWTTRPPTSAPSPRSSTSASTPGVPRRQSVRAQPGA